MKVVQLNSACHGSTGMLMEILSQAMTEKGIENRMLYTFGKDPAENGFRYSSDAEIKLNALCSRITGRYGFVSEKQTGRLIQFLKDYQPDLVQIHTIHGHDLNMTRFFQYLKEAGIPQGFIIQRVNDEPMKSISDLSEAVKKASTSKEPVLYIQGLMPTGKKAYFAVALQD